MNKPGAPWKNEETATLKRMSRRAEHKWRKTKLQIHFDILKENIVKYNQCIKIARQAYFSNLIASNKNKPRILFSTVNRIINPPRSAHSELLSTAKCDEFAKFFKDKIANIRMDISTKQTSDLAEIDPVSPPKSSLGSFNLTNENLLNKVINSLKSLQKKSILAFPVNY